MLKPLLKLRVFRAALLSCAAVTAVCVMPVSVSYAQESGAIVIERSDDHFAIEDNLYYAAIKQLKREKALKHPKDLTAFYQNRAYKGYWTKRTRVFGHADDFIDVLSEAWTHGLNPNTYHYDALLALDDAGDELSVARMEILLSDAYLRYGQDLTGIRVNPAAFKSHKRFWQKPLTAESLFTFLVDDDIDDIVAEFTPRGNTYNRLRDALIALAEEKPEPYEAILPIRMKRLLRPYEGHRTVKDLRVRLGVDHDPSDGSLETTYDDGLVAAVMAFQEENGLKADGVIGPSTLHALNLTRVTQMHQIIANLERLRWVAEEKPDRFVVVNVPSAKLWAIDDGAVEFEMPVIVGRKKRPTNIFITEITGVRFNPNWTVPPTIKKEDIVPKLIEDPYYLSTKSMELISGRGEGAMSLDPASIDWANATPQELAGMRMVQTPGSHNPLGRVRVLMPNGYNIYLHDTNEKYLFSREGRAASSGCVRMKEPVKMADFILRGKNGWSDARQDKVLASSKTADIFIQKTIPVYIVYYTIWLNDKDGLTYGNDLYGYDDALIKMLSNIDGFFIPVDNT